ncbi:hypothetical protein J4427_02300 [Candidatus Woesearchaeota archaeon]|nr:hypothetical protein [Candidatus Woesearchaeota archaeon]
MGITLASLVFGLGSTNCKNVEWIEKEGCNGAVVKYPNQTMVLAQPEYFRGFDTNDDGIYEKITQGGEDIPYYPELVDRAIRRLDETKNCIMENKK